MATIRKRGEKWQVQVRRSGQKAVTRTFDKRAEALIWSRSLEAEMDTAIQPEKVIELADTSLAQVIERYRDTVTPHKKSARQEVYRLNRLLRHPICRLKLDQLSTGVFAGFRDERLQEVGDQQVRHDLNAFAIILRTARSDWDIPLASIPPDTIRKPKLPPGRDRRLMDGEYELLRSAAGEGGSHYIWSVIVFAVETAMRQSEILGLEWTDINLPARLARLRETKNGLPRSVPLTTTAVEVLRGQRQERLAKPFPFTVRMVQHAWKVVLKKAQITDLHFHDLRHEGISRLFELGLSIPEVRIISGHKDFRMLARYTHLKADSIIAKLP